MPRPKRSNPKIKHQAIELRKELTPADPAKCAPTTNIGAKRGMRKLWSRIRNDQLGVTFRRQHAVGNYIPDFSPNGDDVLSQSQTHY